jgi:hypothetical protein
VHIFGEDAAELLHIGQAVFLLRGKITYFADTVFNDPTLAECYKAAAFNGLNRRSDLARVLEGKSWADDRTLTKIGPCNSRAPFIVV